MIDIVFMKLLSCLCSVNIVYIDRTLAFGVFTVFNVFTRTQYINPS